MTFFEKMRLRQARTGKPFFKLCREMGSAGGKKAAFNCRQRKQALARKAELFHGEQARQVAQKLLVADAVPDSVMTEQDRQSIAFDVQRRQVASGLPLVLLFLFFIPSGCLGPALARTTSHDRPVVIDSKPILLDGRLAGPNLKRGEVTIRTTEAPASFHPARVGSNPAPSLLLRCTAYSFLERDHRRYGRLNCMGTRLDDGQCAADLSLFPLGTLLEIPGVGRRLVTDCGSAVLGRHIDLHFSSLTAMNAWGSRTLSVRVLRKGWPK